MKKPTLRTLSLLLAGLLLSASLFACAPEGAPEDTVPPDGTAASTEVPATQPDGTSTEAATEAETQPPVTEPPSVSLDQLTFTPASVEGQVLTEKGHSPQILIRNYNETATDALGRVLPTSAEAGLPKEGKYVGLFYSLWTVGAPCEVDNSKVMARDPYDPDFGPRWGFCFWTEPETGYHRGDDVWQIRRDLYYFAMAGVDFLYFDLTNGILYEDAMTVFLDTCLQMRAEGQMTPYLVPWCFGTATPGHGDTGRFYELFMTEEKYSDLWFYWEGKPLALVKPLDDGTFPILEDPSYADKLTFRKAWTMPNARASELYWSDNNIVNFGYGYGYKDKRTEAECAGIGCAGFANFGAGRSGSLSTKAHLNAFLETDTMGQGLVFEDAFNQLMEKNPECQVLLISRWNEWVAQNFTDPADRGTDTGFVDQFNAEFSRDIEPMKGGFTDNYFYQMCSIIRRFKGVLPADGVSGANTMTETDPAVFERWEEICPVYTDFEGDTAHRNHLDTTGRIRYINTTGRNDIVESRITADGSCVYFYVRAAESLTSYRDGENWMLLFIDADADKTTGWEGYDFLINYEVISDTVTTLCAYRDGVWQEVGTLSYALCEDRLTVTVPRSLLGLTGETVKLNFHWMDNVTDVYDMESWFTTGDSAPERRNNYAYAQAIPYTGEGEVILPPRTSGTVNGMPAVTLSEEDLAVMQAGLTVSCYPLVKNYPAQPDFRLIDALLTDTRGVDTLTAEGLGYTADVGLLYEGYVKIPETGSYAFELSYDDGARLWIDGRLVADGTYDPEAGTGVKTARGSLILCAGYHAIRVEYAELRGGDPHLSLKGDWEFFRVVHGKKPVEAGMILEEDFDDATIPEVRNMLELDETLTLEEGWLCGKWIEGRCVRYNGDLRYYALETRMVAGRQKPGDGPAYRAAIALRVPVEQSIGTAALYEPDNGDGDSTSYLGTSGIFLYGSGNTLEVAVHIKDETRARGVTSLGYTFTLPAGATFDEGVVIRCEDKGDTVTVFCEGVLLATVKLSDLGRDGDQSWKADTYRYAEVLDADGNTVLTTEGHVAYIPAEGNFAFVERASSFKLDYIELYQFGYRYEGDEIIPTE